MESLIQDMDQATLRQLLVERTKAWCAETDQTKKDELLAEINVMKKELSDAVQKENKLKLENTTFSENKVVSAHAQREIMNSLSSIPSFAPGMDVHLHINRLQNLFNIYVSGRDNEDQLEPTFVRNAKKLLNDSYMTQLVNSGKSTDTWDEYKSYLVGTHESKLTHFQRLNQLFEITPREKESFVDLAGRLENMSHEIRLSILAQWKKNHATDTDIPSKAMFDLISAQILIQHIQQSKHRDCYKYIASDLEKDWTCSEVANRAVTILDRVKTDQAQPTSASFVAEWSEPNNGDNNTPTKKKDKKKQKKSKFTPDPNKDCWYWMDPVKGCKKGDKCGWRHDPAKKGVGRPKPESEAVSLVTLPNFTSFQN